MIELLLDQLANLQDTAAQMRAHYNNLRAQAIPPEVQAILDEIADEEQAATQAAQTGIDALTEQVKTLVIEHGSSVKGSVLHAVYSAPRVTWDGKLLEGYAVAHPEINAARKVGAPSVSIRGVK